MKVSNSSEDIDNGLIFHFVSETGENSMDLNEDVKQYVSHFFDKLYVEYEIKPNSIGLIGDVSTMVRIVGILVQDYEKYKGLNGVFIPI
jgi:hypothetical protein